MACRRCLPMRSRLFAIGVLCFAAVGFLVWGWGWVAAGDWGGTLAFAIAATLIALFDVWLPRGDATDMSGALVFAASLLLGPIPGAIVVVFSRLATAIAYRRSRGVFALIDDIGRRLATVVWVSLVFAVLGGTSAALGAPAGDTYLRVLLAAVFFFGLDTALLQISASLRLSSSFLALLVGNVRLLGWVDVAQVSVAVLSSLIYGAMGGWGLLIVSVLLLVMRQSFALLIDVKRAYRSTVEVLARALEAHDPERRGHAERVAEITTEAGRVLGMHGQRLEDLMHAALFHDVGRLGDEGAASGGHGSAAVLRDVNLMKGALPILTVLDERGAIGESLPEATLVSAYIIARSSEFDDEQHGIQHDDISKLVGSRLYASTRHDVDRALRRLEAKARDARFLPSAESAREAW